MDDDFDGFMDFDDEEDTVFDDGDCADDFEDAFESNEDDRDGDCCDEADTVPDDGIDSEGEGHRLTWGKTMFWGGVLGSAYEEWAEKRKQRKRQKGWKM